VSPPSDFVPIKIKVYEDEEAAANLLISMAEAARAAEEQEPVDWAFIETSTVDERSERN